MSPAATLLAAVALVPAMTGPIAAMRGREATVLLCGGGMVSIPLDRAPAPSDGNAPCCSKGCHSGQSRKRAGRST